MWSFRLSAVYLILPYVAKAKLIRLIFNSLHQLNVILVNRGIESLAFELILAVELFLQFSVFF